MIGAGELRGFWLAMGGHLWLAGLVILALAAIERTLLRGGPARVGSWLWTVSLVVLCVPAAWIAVLLEGALAAWFAQPAAGAFTGGAMLREVIFPTALVSAPSGSALPSIWLVLTLVWAVGGLGLTVVLLRRGRSVAADVTTVEPVMGKRLAAAAGRAGIDRRRIVLTGGTCMPHARGLLWPRVVVPGALVDALEIEELAAVLAHEQAHLRRRDPARWLVCRIALPIFWFFPLTWLVLRRLRRSAEMACDEAVLRAGFSPTVYARAIARTVQLGVGSGSPEPAWALARAPRTEIRQRLQAIRNPVKETKMSKSRIAVAATVLVLAAAVAAASPEGPLPQNEIRAFAEIAPNQREQEFENLLGLRGVGRELDFETTDTLRNVLLRLARVGAFGVEFEDHEVASEVVTLRLEDTTVGEALAHLARSYGLSYVVESRRDLLVRRAPPVESKRFPQEPQWKGGPRVFPEGPYRVGGENQAPDRIHHVAPVYPPEARAAGLQGVVILEARIDEEGNVRDVDVLRGLGLGLDEAAREAVRQWKYTPSLYNGEPVEVLLTVTVQYQLRDEAGAAGVIRERAADPRQVGGAVAAPKPVRQVDPIYPEEAREAGLEGEVWIEAVVQQDGSVTGARILRGLNEAMDRAALAALEQWRFEPGTENGEPVPVEAVFTMTFRLNE